ncbi:MAG TPA: ABC transporter permease [Gemmatimonadales bacterium]
MDTLLQDVRYAVRSLRKSPGYTSVAILTLALGIGVNSAVFSVLSGVVLRPLPYTAPDHLYMLLETRDGGGYRSPSYPTFVDWREQADVFDGLAFIRGATTSLRGDEGTARILGAFVSEGFFEMLGTRPLLGRTFAQEEERPGGHHVAVLTHALWLQRFGGDQGVLGTTMTLDHRTYTIIGVLPPGARYPDWADVYMPLAIILPTDRALTQRGLHADSRTVARLRTDVTVPEARAGMGAVATRLAAAYPDENAGWTGVEPLSLVEEVLGFGAVRPMLLLLSGAVALVLLLACANLANMSLMRAATRSRELAIRAALGAGRGRVARLLLAETAVLVLVGGTLGVLFTWWVIGLLRTVAPEGLPRVDEIALDERVLGFTVLVSLLAVVLVGLAPAVRAAAPRLAESLKEGSLGAVTGGVRSRLRSSLVALEVALALVLLIGAGLLIRSFWLLSTQDPGFNPSRVVTLDIFPPGPKYDAPERALALYQRVAGAIAALPGVDRVALSNHVPLSGAWLPSRVEVPGHTPAEGQDESVLFRTVSAEYFETMQIPVRRGRGFTEGDVASAARVAMVNQALARRYWGDQDPVGRYITLFKSAQNRSDFGERFAVQIVGVVANVRHTGLEDDPGPEVYIPYTVNLWGHMVLVARTVTDPDAMVPALRRAVIAVDRDIPVASGTRAGGFATMNEVLASALARRRFTVTLLGAFAAGALLLAALGIYGVISYVVALRTREIGLRTALGATPRAIVRLVITQSARVVAVGLVAGLAGAVGLTRFLTGLVYGVGVTDIATFASVTVFFSAVALLASYLPARRATRVDPMVALRTE